MDCSHKSDDSVWKKKVKYWFWILFNNWFKEFPKREFVCIVVSGLSELILPKLFYIGHGAGYLTGVLIYIFAIGYKFDQSIDGIENLKKAIKILSAPSGYINYLDDQLNDLMNLHKGFKAHTSTYTNILAKTIKKAKCFDATWTIDINLEHMSNDYQEMQMFSECLLEKRRFLMLSKDCIKKQLENKQKNIKDFINWHSINNINLFYVDPAIIKNKLRQELGICEDEIGNYLRRFEDFILIDRDLILFYDTSDSINEGDSPKKEDFYSIVMSTKREICINYNNLLVFMDTILQDHWVQIRSINDMNALISEG